MDILYKLPLPKEVCSKIFMYACKSPPFMTTWLGSWWKKASYRISNGATRLFRDWLHPNLRALKKDRKDNLYTCFDLEHFNQSFLFFIYPTFPPPPNTLPPPYALAGSAALLCTPNTWDSSNETPSQNHHLLYKGDTSTPDSPIHFWYQIFSR